MKKLVLETTAPFQGLPELVADEEGLFAQGGPRDRMGRARERRQEHRRQRQQPEGAQPVLQPRQDARAGQGRHVQRLRMGQLLPRPGHQGRQPPGRPARHRHLRRHRGAAGFAGVTPRSNSPARTVGVPFYFGTHYLALHLLEGFMPREADQALPHLERLAAALRRDDARRDRGDHADRALRHAGREEGLPADLRGVLSRHRGRLRPGRRRDLRRVQPRGARGGEAHQRRQGDVPPLLHRLSQGEGRRDRARCKPQDLRASRIVVCDPAPIPLDEMQRTYDWLKSWGMLEQTATPLQLVNLAGPAARAHGRGGVAAGRCRPIASLWRDAGDHAPATIARHRRRERRRPRRDRRRPPVRGGAIGRGAERTASAAARSAADFGRARHRPRRCGFARFGLRPSPCGPALLGGARAWPSPCGLARGRGACFFGLRDLLLRLALLRHGRPPDCRFDRSAPMRSFNAPAPARRSPSRSVRPDAPPGSPCRTRSA